MVLRCFHHVVSPCGKARSHPYLASSSSCSSLASSCRKLLHLLLPSQQRNHLLKNHFGHAGPNLVILMELMSVMMIPTVRKILVPTNVKMKLETTEEDQSCSTI